MTFSEKLTILRKRRGLSQEQLAEMLDVSRQSVSKWEAQQALPETSKIIMISEIFNVSIDLLLKDEQTIEIEETTKIILELTKKTEELNVMYCTKCGKENAIDSSFCGYCGNPFSPLGTPIEEISESQNNTILMVAQSQEISFPVGSLITFE